MVRRTHRKLSAAERLVVDAEEILFPEERPSDHPLRRAAGRLQDAIAKYSEAIELDPNLAAAYIGRSFARRQAGDLSGSRADGRTAYKLRPRDPWDYLRIAFPFAEGERREIIRTGIARARTGSFGHFQLALNASHTYWYEGRFDLELRATLRIIREFEALGKSRMLAHAHYQAGTALMAMGRFAAAERRLRAAFGDRATAGMLARTSVIESHLYRDDPRGALRVLDEVAPRLDPALVALTRAYIQALQPETLSVPKALVTKLLAPEHPGRHDYMGAVILLRVGRAAIAKPRLRRFIKRCEGNPREWGVTMRWEIRTAKKLLRDNERGRATKSGGVFSGPGWR